MTHQEHHRSHRSGWLRAAVLGANDGIVSTSSLILGVAAASTAQNDIVLAGACGVGRGGHVDGGGGVCLGQLSIGYRAR